MAGLLAHAQTNSQSARVGQHTLGSCLPITLGVTLEQQLREVKAGNSLAWLYSQGAGLVGQLWLATGLVQGMWSGHLLLTSSISCGDCWWLPLDWQVWCWPSGRSSSGTVTSPMLSLPGSAAEEGAGWQTAFRGRRGVGLNSLMVQLPGSRQGWEEGPAQACLAEGKARERGSPESALWCSTLGRR